MSRHLGLEELDDDELVALAIIRQILKEGLVTWGCKNAKVETPSRGELEVEFEWDGKHYHFYFG